MGLNPGKGSTGLSAQQMVSPMKAIKHGSTLELEDEIYVLKSAPSSEFFILQTIYLHIIMSIIFSRQESQVCVTCNLPNLTVLELDYRHFVWVVDTNFQDFVFPFSLQESDFIAFFEGSRENADKRDDSSELVIADELHYQPFPL